MMLWKAVYSDNTELNQYENGQEQSWKKIDLGKIKFFDLMDGDKRVFRLHLFDGRELVYRRRVVMNYNASGENIVYLVGWKKDNIQSIAYIHEADGTVLISGGEGLEEPYSPPVYD
jgi:hypothetical protein